MPAHHLRRSTAALAASLLAASCMTPAGAPPPVVPAMVLAPSLDALTNRAGADWSTWSVSSPEVIRRRQAYIEGEKAARAGEEGFGLLAWPSFTTNWKTGANAYPGVTLASLGAGATDVASNGPAAVYGGSAALGLKDKVFFLTKAGLLIKVDKTNPATSPQKVQLGAGETFTRSFVTLSPKGSRAYCVSDSGKLYVVDTTNAMKVWDSTNSVAGGFGIAPAVDPLRSNAADTLDDLYVPGNDGNVKQFHVSAAGPGQTPTITAVATHPVANGTTPIADATYNPSNNRIQAPCVVLNGVILVGDMGGNLKYHDTNDTTNNVSYPLGTSGIQVAPAVEIQDGTYSLTDPLGNPTTVPYFTPIYAFVNVNTKDGGKCAWLDLVARSTAMSRTLYFDDNDLGKKADEWHDYNYKITNVTRLIEARDGGNVAMDATNLPGVAPAAHYSNTYLTPAQTNLTAGTTAANYAANQQCTGVAFDTAGQIWVTNKNQNKVTVLTSAGAIATTYAVGNTPMGIALDQNSGDMWVANQAGNSVSKISGGVVTTYSAGLGLNQPTALAVDASGNVWIANKGANNIVEISSAGAFIKNKAVGTSPVSIAIDDVSGDVWVANNGSNNVTRLDSGATVKGTYAMGAGTQPDAITVAPTGNAWVGCFGTDTVKEVNTAGTILTTLTVKQCQGIVADGAGDIWATSKNMNSVVQISGGAILNTLLTQTQPFGVDVGAAGVAVANQGSDTVTVTNAPGGGPVYTYLRFEDAYLTAPGYAAGSQILSGTLSLTTINEKHSCYPPEIWSIGTQDADGSTGFYKKGTTVAWTSNGGLTSTTAHSPVSNVGTWVGGGINGKGLVNFGAKKQYDWDVTPGLGNATPVKHYALMIKYSPANTSGNNVYWPDGPLAANDKGNKPPFNAPSFENNALWADATAPTNANDTRPLLTLKIGVNAAVPNYPVATAPVIDSVLKKVYVFNTNYLFELDFRDRTKWTDTEYSAATGLGTKYTKFNTAYWGSQGGATTNNKTAFVRNTTTPLPAYDLSSMYVLNYYPKNGNGAPPYTLYDVAVTRITLPLTAGTDQQSPNTGAPGSKVANTLTNSASNAGQIASPTGSSYMVLDPFANATTKGGGIYLGLDATKMIYKLDPP